MEISLNSKVQVNQLTFGSEPYILPTPIKDVLVIRRPQYTDERGFFQEEFRVEDISKIIGRQTSVAQSQVSYSTTNVLRGIHAEPWDKIITPLTGKLVNLVLDLREESDTYKKWIMFEFDLTDPMTNRTTLFVPEGCGNAMMAFGGNDENHPNEIIYQYSASSVYRPGDTIKGVVWNDTSLKIPWPTTDVILSNKDRSLSGL